MLGPLCVGLCVVRVEDWSPGQGPPDVWKLLRAAVCRRPNDARRRVAVADSKKLKLANDSARHPLTHLERGVASLGPAPYPDSDSLLFSAMGTRLNPSPWYVGEQRLPVANDSTELRLARNAVARAMTETGVRVLSLRCEALTEPEFNERCRTLGSKAAVSGELVARLIGEVMHEHAGDDEVRLVCDRQSGRTSYAELLAQAGFSSITPEEESARCSRYSVRLGARAAAALFIPEAEDRHLPVALASMTAKLARELAMARFNAYFAAREPELKPTAGYYADARRWLHDARDILSPSERGAIIRIA